MGDGTEALSGDTSGATPPPSMTVPFTDSMQGAPPVTPAAPTPQAPAAAAAPATNAPAAPATPSPAAHSGFDLLDLLVNPNRSTVAIDSQGQRHTVPAVPLTRKQQLGHLLATALEGAATGASAPPGPGHVSQGVSAAVSQQFQQASQQKQQQNDQAEQDFQRQQKAHMDNINYQLLQRKVATAALDDRLKETKANQETVTFANGLMDREKALGSYDLGTVKDAGEIASTISKLPDWEQHLYEQNTLMPVPIYGPDGKPQGLQLYLRKQDPKTMPAAPDTKVPKWVPPGPGETAPKTVYFTPVGASVGDIDNYNAKYLNDESTWRTGQAKLEHEQAGTAREKTGATLDIAKAAEARANAAKAYADAEKSKRESAVLGGDGNDAAGMTHDQIVDGMLHGKVDITKAVGIFRNPTARAQFIAEALQKDPTWSMAKFKLMQDMNTDLVKGKMGDQVQSFQTFTGHAMGLIGAIDSLHNTNAKILNTPINKLKKDVAGNAALADVIPQIEAVRNEFQNFLANHALQKQEIARGEAMLDENQSPAQMMAAVKSFETIALTKLGAVNYRYKRTVGEDIPRLLDPNSAKAINDMGLGAYATHALNLDTPASAQPTSTQPNHAQALASGVPAGAQPGRDTKGNIVGYQDATGWHNLPAQGAR